MVGKCWGAYGYLERNFSAYILYKLYVVHEQATFILTSEKEEIIKHPAWHCTGFAYYSAY